MTKKRRHPSLERSSLTRSENHSFVNLAPCTFRFLRYGLTNVPAGLRFFGFDSICSFSIAASTYAAAGLVRSFRYSSVILKRRV